MSQWRQAVFRGTQDVFVKYLHKKQKWIMRYSMKKQATIYQPNARNLRIKNCTCSRCMPKPKRCRLCGKREHFCKTRKRKLLEKNDRQMKKRKLN